MIHLEAFSCERAALHFENAGLTGFVADYMGQAHALYDQWGALAKIIAIEDKYATLLKISKRRKPMAAGYLRRNEKLRYHPKHSIGGGHGEIKPINVKKVVKKRVKNTRRNIKVLFGKNKGKKRNPGKTGSPPHSPREMDSRSAGAGKGGSPASSPSKRSSPTSSPTKRTPLPPPRPRILGIKKDHKNENDGMMSPLKSPFGKPKIKLPFSGKKNKKKKKKNENKDNLDDNNELVGMEIK